MNGNIGAANMNGQYNPGDVVLGNWTLMRLIGEGSFGRVFEAEREDFGTTYRAAIKIISIPQSQREVKSLIADGMDKESIEELYKSYVEEFTGTLSLMASFKGTTNILSYEDHVVEQHENSIGWDIIIRMEWLTPASEYFRDKNLNNEDVKKLGIDICQALDLLQKSNIIHNGVKLENIFVTDIGDYKLGGFETVCTIGKKDDKLSMKGANYTGAPEVLRGEAYGISADIYSLGIIMYKLLNKNRMPLLPDYPAPVSYADREVASIKRLNGEKLPAPKNATKEMAAIILKACAFDPEDRYTTPMQMAQDLKHSGLEEFARVVYASPVFGEDGVLPAEPFNNLDECEVEKKRNNIKATSKEIYKRLAVESRDKLYPGKARYMVLVFSKLAPVFFPETHYKQLLPNQVEYLNTFHSYVFSSRCLTRMATGWSIEEANSFIIRQYPNLAPDAVKQAIDISMGFLYKQFSQVEHKDNEEKKLLATVNKSVGLEQNASSNDAVIDLHLNDPEYGLTPSKPVFTKGFQGERAYVESLISSDGRRVEYERIGSKQVEGIYGPVDIFKLRDTEGKETTIYVSLYANKTSEKAPLGFSLRGNANTQSTTPKPIANVSSFDEALNSYQFYFSLLPAMWNTIEHRKMLITIFDEKGGKGCMGFILHAMNATFFPEQQNNALMKIIGLKMIDDYNNENYSKLFVIDRVDLDDEHHVFEVEFLMYLNQNLAVKVEKVFFECTTGFSQGKVIALESSAFSDDKILCQVGHNENRTNFGSIKIWMFTKD